jgi:glycosyltransferase involved in cell wall biosynthesis
MFRGHVVAVVVPAHDEADKIAAIVASIPDYVDHVIVVDDGSSDGTAGAAGEVEAQPRLEVIVHPENRGVGAAIATGYARALALGAQAIGVMAGDGQMDPGDLAAVLAPVVEGSADYVKGNRWGWPGAWRVVPPVRLAGSHALCWLTRLATGYWHIHDPQCGYTAASRWALETIGPARMFPRYGYPNDLLARLSLAGARVVEVPVRPVYGPAWRSGLRPARVAVPIARMLLRWWLRRLRSRLAGGAAGNAPARVEGPSP